MRRGLVLLGLLGCAGAQGPQCRPSDLCASRWIDGKELKQTLSKLQEREGDIVGWSIKKWVVQPKQSIQQAIPYLRTTQHSIGAADPVSPISPHDEDAAVTRAITV